ncbi:hypothetical protein EZV62_005290 [Acer yangbiense]|uniref:Bis(5'-adenosyl)-triphosphatase n=1 Tax=Acer yangbiense TaxID=1000413 RepID=A0A5C7IMA6_9ROSI|nr:hypothetical protein EZV62_005290 [Acer yangbiense]
MVKQLLQSLSLTPTTTQWLISSASRRLQSISTTRHIEVQVVKTQMSLNNHYMFGPYKIDSKEVFYSTPLSYAMVNLRPLLPGHILFSLKIRLREVKRFFDLTADETSDLWLSAQKVGKQLECYHKASSLTFSIQDGPQAGQTVPHVHIHIVPRKGGDFENNDEIYEAMDVKEKELKQKLDLDKERTDRSLEEMAQEADAYRQLFL